MPHNKLLQNYKVQSDLYKTATNKAAIYQSPNLFDTKLLYLYLFLMDNSIKWLQPPFRYQ